MHWNGLTRAPWEIIRCVHHSGWNDLKAVGHETPKPTKPGAFSGRCAPPSHPSRIMRRPSARDRTENTAMPAPSLLESHQPLPPRVQGTTPRLLRGAAGEGGQFPGIGRRHEPEGLCAAGVEGYASLCMGIKRGTGICVCGNGTVRESGKADWRVVRGPEDYYGRGT